MNDKTISMLTDMLHQIEHTVVHYTPIAWKAAQEVTRLDCLGQIVTGSGCLLFALVCGIAAGWGVSNIVRIERENISRNYSKELPGAPYKALTVYVSVAGFVACIVASCNLFDWWAWIGIWHPDLFLIHEAMQKALH